MKSLSRYLRHEQGDSIERIAESDEVSLQTARNSVVDGCKRIEMELQKQILRYKLEGQLENEKLRRMVRKRLGPKFLAALEKLLDGRKVIISRNKDTGQIKVEEIVDNTVILTGVESYAKSTSLLEKPGPSATVVNVHQNNTPPPAGAMSFESILAKIREEQKRVGLVYEAEVERARAKTTPTNQEKNAKTSTAARLT